MDTPNDRTYQRDQEDYARFVHEIGLTEEDMEQARRRFDEEAVEQLPDALYRRESMRHGDGVFTRMGFKEPVPQPDGNWMCACITRCYAYGRFTLAGVLANHSMDPNAMARPFGNGLFFFATKKIEPGEEITVNYRQIYEVVTAFRKLEEAS